MNVDEFIFIRKLKTNAIRIFVDNNKYLNFYLENDIKNEKYQMLGALITIKIFENYTNIIQFNKTEILNLNYFDYNLFIEPFECDIEYISLAYIKKEFCHFFISECKYKLIEIIESKNNIKLKNFYELLI